MSIKLPVITSAWYNQRDNNYAEERTEMRRGDLLESYVSLQVGMLLGAGADVAAQGNSGQTQLHMGYRRWTRRWTRQCGSERQSTKAEWPKATRNPRYARG